MSVNGKQRHLHGVNRHQNREGKAWALTEDDEREDVALISELGADTIRTAHYPQSRHFYSLCDRAGIFCWVELPLVDEINPNECFRLNAINTAREMTAQLGNHPSIFIWSVFNELYNGNRSAPTGPAEKLVREINDLFHWSDSTRPTTCATCVHRKKELNRITDTLGDNTLEIKSGNLKDAATRKLIKETASK